MLEKSTNEVNEQGVVGEVCISTPPPPRIPEPPNVPRPPQGDEDTIRICTPGTPGDPWYGVDTETGQCFLITPWLGGSCVPANSIVLESTPVACPPGYTPGGDGELPPGFSLGVQELGT